MYHGRCLLCCSPPRYSYPAPDTAAAAVVHGVAMMDMAVLQLAIMLLWLLPTAVQHLQQAHTATAAVATADDNILVPSPKKDNKNISSAHTLPTSLTTTATPSLSPLSTANNEIFRLLSRIMHRHPNNLQTHISSFHTLWVLSWETDNARSIGHVGGIPILLKSLRYHLTTFLNIANRYNRNCNHSTSPSSQTQMQLQANGLATLHNLSVTKLNKDLLVQNDGISHILLVMSTFCENKDIQFSGYNALANILSNAP